MEPRTVHVLYMEDDAGMARLLQMSLQRQGYVVDIAGNGEEGLRMADQSHYDIVLVDYNMPMFGGIEVLRMLKGRKDFPPIIMVTGNGNEKIAVEALKNGASDYIVKDVDMGYLELLPMVIEKALHKRQLLKEREEMYFAVKESEERYRKLNAELEQRIMERTAQLEASNRELEGFCYAISHDLRAPLIRLEGFSRALLEDGGERLNPQGKLYAERIESSSRHLRALIDALLDMTRHTRSEMYTHEVNLSAITHSVASELKKEAPMRDVEFIVAPDAVANGDPRLLQVVLENLIGNAWKFTEKHEIARIEFGVAEDEGGPVFFVRDDGAGFDMRYAEKMFQPFQRLHSPAEFHGTGIGLATVQRIIQRHGGRIWAEGEEEKGATFYFTLH